MFHPHAVHCGPVEASNACAAGAFVGACPAEACPAGAEDEGGHMAAAEGVKLSGDPRRLPLNNSAKARRSAAVLLFAIVTIVPVSIDARTRSAVIESSASRRGARFSPVSWHWAQLRL